MHISLSIYIYKNIYAYIYTWRYVLSSAGEITRKGHFFISPGVAIRAWLIRTQEAH